jgi:hypothetical protein
MKREPDHAAAPAPLDDIARIEALKAEAERARHGERARARTRLYDGMHDLLRRELGIPSPQWWRRA